MTPLMIEIMLWYNCRADEYGRCDDNLSAPAVKEALKWLDGRDMLKCSIFEGDATKYTITDKGSAYVQALCRVGLPDIRWHVEMAEAG